MLTTHSHGLREQAKRYIDAGEKLLAAADALDGLDSPAKKNGDIHKDDREEQTPEAPAATERPAAPRLTELKEFVLKNAPITRKEIIDRSGLPIGTISYLLKPENGFVRLGHKKWGCKQ